MKHLDEGTIHAWLDGGGALDATQSREIEAHVAACATCSAAVAEARGLIAGASRILGALDDVPAGVIPGGASAAPKSESRDGVTPIGSRREAPRRWRVTRWASGIAAVLVAAIVLSTSSKVDRSGQPSERDQASTVDTADIGAPRTAADEAVTAVGSAVERPMGAPNAPAGLESRVAAPAAGGAAGSQAAAASAGESAPERREAVPAAPPAVAPAPARETGTLAGRVSGVSVSRTAAANQAKTEPATEAVQQDTARIRTSLRRDTTRLRTTSDARFESVVVTGLGAARDSVAERFIGCYRIDAGRGVAADAAKSVAAEAAGAGQRRVAQRAAAPSSAAAPQTSDFSARGLPAVVRLDTTETERGRMVRVGPDSTIGSWRVVGDSVLIDLGPRGSVRMSARQKIDCP